MASNIWPTKEIAIPTRIIIRRAPRNKKEPAWAKSFSPVISDKVVRLLLAKLAEAIPISHPKKRTLKKGKKNWKNSEPRLIAKRIHSPHQMTKNTTHIKKAMITEMRKSLKMDSFFVISEKLFERNQDKHPADDGHNEKGNCSRASHKLDSPYIYLSPFQVISPP